MFLQMSYKLCSEDELLPPSPPNAQLKPMYICRKRKRVEETVEYISAESDTEDEQPLPQFKKRKCAEWILNAKPGCSKTPDNQTQPEANKVITKKPE